MAPMLEMAHVARRAAICALGEDLQLMRTCNSPDHIVIGGRGHEAVFIASARSATLVRIFKTEG